MPPDPPTSAPAAAPALSYDELPEGSALRRRYDGRGGVTITAPAGELPASLHRVASRAALVPATFAMVACGTAIGLLLLRLAQSNRLDPSLREAAMVALAALAGGVFLFVWLTRYLALCEALLAGRRHASVLHADPNRLLLETTRPSDGRSIDVPVGMIRFMKVTRAALDDRRLPRVACLQLLLRDGTVHVLFGGHHTAELHWIAASVSGVTGVPLLSDGAATKAGVS